MALAHRFYFNGSANSTDGAVGVATGESYFFPVMANFSQDFGQAIRLVSGSIDTSYSFITTTGGAVVLWGDINANDGVLFNQHDGSIGLALEFSGGECTLRVNDQLLTVPCVDTDLGHQIYRPGISSYTLLWTETQTTLVVNGQVEMILEYAPTFPAQNFFIGNDSALANPLDMMAISLYLYDDYVDYLQANSITREPYSPELPIAIESASVPTPTAHYDARIENSMLMDEQGYRDLRLSGTQPALVDGPQGQVEKGMLFNNTGFWYAADSTFFRWSGDMTVAFWIKNSVGGLATRDNPLGKSYGAEFTLTQETSGHLNFFNGQAGTNGNPYTSRSTGPFPEDVWVHCCFTRSLANGTIRGYVNGILTNEKLDNYTSLSTSSYDFYIGQGYINQGYRGSLSDIRMWEQELSPQEVAGLVSADSSFIDAPTTPIGYSELPNDGFDWSRPNVDGDIDNFGFMHGYFNQPEWYYRHLQDDQQTHRMETTTWIPFEDFKFSNQNRKAGPINVHTKPRIMFKREWGIAYDEQQNVRTADFSKHGFIEGSISDEFGTPQWTRVRLFDYYNGKLVDEVWSNEAGVYRFDFLNTDIKYTVVAVDNTKQYNSVIADNATPEAYNP